ncbi:Lipase maturation factor 2 [Lamellibrachia satsuma]|nr:Lipase maturation factor 2 [Lamellibrachia satsuma]
MFLIILTGNYNFFNWLYMVVCLPLVTDGFLWRWMGYTPSARERSDLPIVGWLARSIRWMCNIVVYGGLFYWTVKLYGLSFKTKPFRIESATMFDSADLDKFLKASVPLGIWIGILSLSWEILAAIVRSLTREPGLYRKVSNLVGCVVIGSVACCLFSVSLVPFTAFETQTRERLPPAVDFTVIEEQSHRNVWPVLHRWHGQTNHLHLTSSYGLFRMMTGVGGRPEVILEGSDLLEKGWKEYEFLYKPGNVSARLPVVAPHQPRLDWQMWFAALGNYNHNPWLVNLVYRLLNNQPEVLALMGKNPFPNKPPKYIRANLYHYHFTQRDPKHQWYSRSDWWVREKVREYLPAISLEDKGLVEYLKEAGIYEKKKSKRSKGQSQAFLPDFMAWFLQKLRSLLRQTSDFMFVVSLFVTGLVLNFLKPSPMSF